MTTPHPDRVPGLQGVKRRVLYVALYELLAIAAATVGLALLSGQGAGHSGVVAVAGSGIAMVWNLGFNWVFERWESRQAVRGRSVLRRMVHAVAFEGGLVLTLVPLFAWWFSVGLWEALLMNLALSGFFLGYTFAFNWLFDRIFGLPASALAAA